jgi:hypothetical protein
MTGKEFLNGLANGRTDAVARILELLEETGAPYCLVGGLAVNAFAEPVVSLDIDVVVAPTHVESVRRGAEARGYRVESFPHSVNIAVPGSDLRIQIQTDPRYGDFPSRAAPAEVLGYRLQVADVHDVLQGKVWAWSDPTRRRSKRHKDLADIARLVEVAPSLRENLPAAVREALGED